MYCLECGKELKLDKEARAKDVVYRFYDCKGCGLSWDCRVKADSEQVVATGYRRKRDGGES